jgi:hypothetical protein
MIADNRKADPTQTEVHHSQVSRYPIKDFSGGHFFQIQFLMGLKRVSLVKKRVPRYVARARRVNCQVEI